MTQLTALRELEHMVEAHMIAWRRNAARSQNEEYAEYVGRHLSAAEILSMIRGQIGELELAENGEKA